MKYQQDLQVKLQERYRRLYKSNYLMYQHEARYLCEFIQKTPALRYAVETIERSNPELDPADWLKRNLTNFGFTPPDTELGRAKLSWYQLQQFAGDERAARIFGHNVASEGDFDSMCRAATEAAVEPFIEYLQERIGDSSDVLHLLERYVRRVEWFEKEQLWTAYGADTAHGEAGYDRDLRRFLFDQGIDYPYSQPRSASGSADIVSNLDGDDPLVCEVKLFDGSSYNVAYVAKGLQQAVSYAHDYAKAVAYLVVVNLSDRLLEWPTDDELGQWPPRLNVAGVTVFIVTVRAKPQPSASKRGRADVLAVARTGLVPSEGLS